MFFMMVLRDRPCARVASSMASHPSGASSTNSARTWSVRRIRHGAPGGDLFAGDEAFGDPPVQGRGWWGRGVRRGGAGGDLFAGDEGFGDAPVQGRWWEFQFRGGVDDGEQLI